MLKAELRRLYLASSITSWGTVLASSGNLLLFLFLHCFEWSTLVYCLYSQLNLKADS